MSDNLQDPVFDGTQTGGMLLWFGAAADAYAAGEREGAAAERERIRQLAISVNAIVFRAAPAPTFEAVPFADLLAPEATP